MVFSLLVLEFWYVLVCLGCFLCRWVTPTTPGRQPFSGPSGASVENPNHPGPSDPQCLIEEDLHFSQGALLVKSPFLCLLCIPIVCLYDIYIYKYIYTGYIHISRTDRVGPNIFFFAAEGAFTGESSHLQYCLLYSSSQLVRFQYHFT